ncbi:uncharacterized protein si:dkey-1k23.3 [Pungitius pungitius]|uniref:uncharacterized protein si:dkey-1k23.3 n=1 Tax=Pungitius pungitius TaxID=134920 RepID=UPI002E15BFA4
MGERDEAEPPTPRGPLGGGGPPWPPRKWRQSSRLFNQDVGMPPLLPEPAEPRWTDDVDRLRWSLAGCPWPGFTPAPLFVPYVCGPTRGPGQQVGKEPCKWRVSLEVAHFFPSEISLSVRDGFLEVGGKHEERPDEHGFIARCFTRKYRLPAEVDVTQFAAVLSVDGVLTVEAPVPKTSVPSPTIIPVKLELEVTGEKLEKYEAPDTELENCRTPEAQSLPSAEQGRGEDSQQEVGGHRADPGGATVGPQQHEEEEEEEESHKETSAESRPPAAVDGGGAASPRDSPEPAVDGEVRAAAGGPGEAAEETARPEGPEPGQTPPSEGPSRELEAAAAVKQEATE